VRHRPEVEAADAGVGQPRQQLLLAVGLDREGERGGARRQRAEGLRDRGPEAVEQLLVVRAPARGGVVGGEPAQEEGEGGARAALGVAEVEVGALRPGRRQIGRASCRERV